MSDPQEAIQMTTLNWASAVESGDPDAVLRLYADDAVLWATMSPVLRSTPEAIREYFVSFCDKVDLKVQIRFHMIRLYGDIAIDTGKYRFTWKEGDGTHGTLARFSFVYQSTPDGYLIVDHHSSFLPEL